MSVPGSACSVKGVVVVVMVNKPQAHTGNEACKRRVEWLSPDGCSK
jgi:hypothetical protein